MRTREYGQYCGLARALDIVGERWMLLILRDLLVGPKRFTDLHRGLPGIPTNVLTERLKELEQAGVVHRYLRPRPASAIVYELTPFGAQLESAIIYLGRWGATMLGEPRPREIITEDSMIMALRTTFHAEATRGVRVRYEFHFGDIVIHAIVSDGAVSVNAGALPGADLIVESGLGLRLLMTRELSPAQALAAGHVRITGDAKWLTTFVDLFRIAPKPAELSA